jgi:hypothetical protein
MAPKTEEKLRKRKETKQKKLLLLLIPALAVVVAIQGPAVMKHFRKAQEKTEHAQSKVVEGFEDVAGTGPATATSEPLTGDPAAAILATQSLADTDTPPVADEGQLISFTRFSARDPFVQLVDDASEETAGSSGDTSTTGGTTTSTPAPSASTGTTTATSSGGDTSTGVATTQASISVNGAVVVVAVGETFPPNDPAFKLVAIDGDIVKIGLAAGSFSNGVDTLDLQAGDSVTLISQPDGGRFTIKIVQIG